MVGLQSGSLTGSRQGTFRSESLIVFLQGSLGSASFVLCCLCLQVLRGELLFKAPRLNIRCRSVGLCEPGIEPEGSVLPTCPAARTGFLA